MIMQSYDFYALYKDTAATSSGGDDQWSNMLGGTELIRRKLGKDAAMTITLLLTSEEEDGQDTEGGSLAQSRKPAPMSSISTGATLEMPM